MLFDKNTWVLFGKSTGCYLVKALGVLQQKHLVLFVKSMGAIWNATGAKWQAKHMGALSVMGPVLVTSIVSFIVKSIGHKHWVLPLSKTLHECYVVRKALGAIWLLHWFQSSKCHG